MRFCPSPGDASTAEGYLRCFASNIVPYLEREGLTYLRTETPHPALPGIPADNLGYHAFSATYGHVYTVRQPLQLFRRSHGQFTPVEDRGTPRLA